MATTRIGIREFRENLASVIEGDSAVAITRHGETVGYYLPARRRPTKEAIARFDAAAAKVQGEMARLGVTEEELVADFEELRRKARQQT